MRILAKPIYIKATLVQHGKLTGAQVDFSARRSSAGVSLEGIEHVRSTSKERD
jgi:hypothetical protein